MSLNRKKIKRKTTQPHTKLSIEKGYEKIFTKIDKAIAVINKRK